MDFDHPQFLFSEAEESSKIRAPTTMKKFEDSEKAKKPVRSMIETRGEKTKEKAKNSKKSKGAKKEGEFELHGRTRACRVVQVVGSTDVVPCPFVIASLSCSKALYSITPSPCDPQDVCS